ncbi:MAG: putative toxin-antitoxin system toxin component, PIN family [Bacillota bacterium]
MPRVTIDTNIIISAILFGGNPEKLIQLASSQKISLILSHDILAETVYILRNKFGWSNNQIESLEIMLREVATIVTPQKRVKVIKNDDPDNRTLECAVEGNVDFIVSGDKKHLLLLRYYNDIPIITAAAFLERV